MLLLDSFHKGDPSSFELDNMHEQQRACKDKLSKGAKQEDPNIACSLTARKQTKEQAKEQEMQLDQARLHSSQQKLEQEKQQTIGHNNSLGTNNRSLGSACNNSSLGNNSLGIGEQQECKESLEQQPLAFQRSSLQIWKILIDTGAELSVAPLDFAAEIQLSPLNQDLQLVTAKGEAIETYGLRTVQLLTQSFSFEMSFVIANVKQPLLGLGSLLRENLTLQLDINLGHQLGSKAGEKIQLEQRGLQLYLSACPTELELTPCIRGNLLNNSLLPEAMVGPKVEKQLGQSELIQGGAAQHNLPLGNLEQHRPQKNKKAIGQQAALPKAKSKQTPRGRTKASKLRNWEKTSYIEQMQLALLEKESKSQLGSKHWQRIELESLLDLELDETVAADNS